MRLIPSASKTQAKSKGHRRGPASKNVQSSARMRASGASMTSSVVAVAKRVFNGRAKRGT